jgi:hypothetical protein
MDIFSIGFAALNTVEQKDASIRLACTVVGISETCYRCSRKRSVENVQLRIPLTRDLFSKT